MPHRRFADHVGSLGMSPHTPLASEAADADSSGEAERMRPIIVFKAGPRQPWSEAPFRLCLWSAACAIGTLGGWSALSAGEPASPKVRKVDYNREVRPILAKNCFACHGQDEAKRAKGLRLDHREGAVKRLKSGERAIVPGDPDSSELIARITEEDESLRMPPKKSGHRLKPSEIDVIRRWILEKAEYTPHWSLSAPRLQPLPEIKQKNWPRNGIDFWILSTLETEGMNPSPEADRGMLLRRASLDLRGLPPTLAEVNEFLNDPAPTAYEKAVDRFLGDPAFGERWARMWLDQARYADSAGYGSDPLRPTIWRYRDWVIDAFNRNLPFDRFTLEQIAGDLLSKSSLNERIATAFHRNTMTNTEGGTDDEEFRVAAIKDRVDTTIQVWMGLTMGCAKCHSHKFDPITHEEYYQFYAILNQTADQDQPSEAPVLAAPTASILERIQQIDREIAAIRLRGPDSKLVRDQIAALEKSKPAIPDVPVMVELSPERHRVTHVLRKGNFLDPGDVVGPGLPHALPPWSEGEPKNRLGLAHWLVDARNPLTARVAVNRYWAQIYGIGLVETEEDFGTQGEPPSHPELLDYLAVWYRESGWNTKSLLRLLVTSATYRQSSKVTPELLKRDPRNRLLARAPRVRLEAEMVPRPGPGLKWFALPRGRWTERVPAPAGGPLASGL